MLEPFQPFGFVEVFGHVTLCVPPSQSQHVWISLSQPPHLFLRAFRCGAYLSAPSGLVRARLNAQHVVTIQCLHAPREVASAGRRWEKRNDAGPWLLRTMHRGHASLLCHAARVLQRPLSRCGDSLSTRTSPARCWFQLPVQHAHSPMAYPLGVWWPGYLALRGSGAPGCRRPALPTPRTD